MGRDGARVAEPAQKTDLCGHLRWSLPSLCSCSNLVTICRGATEELNTLARIAHPDVKVGNPAHSGLAGPEVTQRGSLGMNHGKETAIKHWEMDSGSFLPNALEKVKSNGVTRAGPRVSIKVKWTLPSPWPGPAGLTDMDTLLLEAGFAFAPLPGCSLGVAGRIDRRAPTCLFPAGLPVIMRAPVATETIT